MARLTLNVDENVVARAKRHAACHGISVSALVERFLALLPESDVHPDEGLPPILARLRRELRGVAVTPSTYRSYLKRKYR